jgi:protoheme IX farnesyltransferase
MPDVKSFYEVIKPKQTTLLMVTCVVSYIVASAHYGFSLQNFVLSSFAVLLTVAGTTALNMWLDSDIDALMPRTKHRPVPSGRLSARGCALYGSALFLAGFLVGLEVNLHFAVVLFAGLFFDIIVYTIMLKRKSPYSIVLGGLAGAMPALAGWTAAAGVIEPAGVLIAAIVLLWIPAHIWYLSMYFEEDYRVARVPMLPLVVGMEKASWAIVLSTSFMLVFVAALYVMFGYTYMILAILLTTYFLYKAIKFALSPSREGAREMYKLASITLGVVYMSMLIGAFT